MSWTNVVRPVVGVDVIDTTDLKAILLFPGTLDELNRLDAGKTYELVPLGDSKYPFVTGEVIAERYASPIRLETAERDIRMRAKNVGADGLIHFEHYRTAVIPHTVITEAYEQKTVSTEYREVYMGVPVRAKK